MGRESLASDIGSLERRAQAERIVVHQARRLWRPHPSDLWRSREMLFYMVVRDVKARYAQTILGALWTVCQPLALLGVFTYAFSRFHHESTGVPYPLWAIAGVALWLFVARAVMQGAGSLLANLPLVSRTAVPRALIPIAAVLSSFVDLLVGVLLFLVLAVGYDVPPTWQFAAVPGVIALAFLLALGLSLVLAPLEARYRDVGRTLPFAVQLWFFLSPVAFELPIPHGGFARLVHDLNPMVGLLESFRWALLGTELPRSHLLGTLAFTAASLLVGVLYFARVQPVLADDL